MRLKVFTAANIRAAMSDIRRDLGPDAIIVSTERTGRGGVTVTAAIEPRASEPDIPKPKAPVLPEAAKETETRIDPEALSAVFAFHRLPEKLAQSLSRAALAMDAEDGVLALAGALDTAFSFSPVSTAPARPLMLVGPPGVGKTIAVAKLAARAVLAERSCLVVTTDTARAGAVAQMEALVERLGQSFAAAETPESLGSVIKKQGRNQVVLVDSLSINPFKREEREMIGDYLGKAEVEPILVLSAGMDPEEAADTAATMTDIGIRRIIGTRLDTARRLGCLLDAADAGGLAFSDVTSSPFIGEGFDALNPVSFARLLVHCSGIKSRISNPRRATK